MSSSNHLDELFATWSSISELCEPLSESQWKTPTSCPGWTVQDIVSHLIGVERVLTGLQSTTHRSSPRDYVKNAMGESNEHEVDSRRSLSGSEVLKEWNEISARRKADLAAADKTYFEGEARTPFGKATVADLIEIRILDCWVHEQDIRRALNIPGHDSGSAAEFTIDRLMRTLPIVIGKRAATPEGESVLFQITGPVHRSQWISVLDGRATVVDSPPSTIRTTFQIDSNTFLALANGRESAEATSTKWTASGDKDLGLRIAQNLNMMI